MYTYGKGKCTLQMTMTLSNGDTKVSNSFNITFDEDAYAIKTASEFSKISFEDLRQSLEKRLIARIQ